MRLCLENPSTELREAFKKSPSAVSGVPWVNPELLFPVLSTSQGLGNPWMSSAAPGRQSRLRSVNLAGTSSSAGVKQIPPQGDSHGEVPSKPPQHSKKGPFGPSASHTPSSHEIQGIPTPGRAVPTSLRGKQEAQMNKLCISPTAKSSFSLSAGDV